MIDTIDAQKWDFKKRFYLPVQLDARCSCYEEDMNKKVPCASCGKMISFGESYTSRQYHTRYGFGYAVCGDCYGKEYQEEMEAEKRHV